VLQAPRTDGAGTFSDVPADSCYAEAVAWAVGKPVSAEIYLTLTMTARADKLLRSYAEPI